MKQHYSDYEEFGYKIFGPFLYGFTQWLRSRIEANGDQNVFFFSRDGYLMQKAYLLFDEKKSLGKKNSYVYFSRNSLRRALLWRCRSYEESLTYLSKERFTDMAKIASYYGLTHDQLIPLMSELHLKWNEGLLFDRLPDNQKVKKVYETFINQINELSYNQYKTVIGYLRQIGLNGNCAIVDIGWNGTMQYYLDKLIEIGEINAKVNGYYVGMSRTVPIKEKAEGFIFSSGNFKYRKSVTCFLGVFEKFLQSLEGSTDSYLVKDSAIIPSLKPYEYEGDNYIQSVIRDLQDGALNYIKNGIKKNLSFSCVDDSCSALIRFGKTPSYAETQMFGFFYITDGEKQYFIPQKPLYKYRPKEFVIDLSNSIWKTGFMKAAFRIPFPYYWIYNLMRR